MKGKLVFLLWAGRMLIEAAELVVRGRRALDNSLGDGGGWRRPPWGGGGGGGRNDFWGGNR